MKKKRKKENVWKWNGMEWIFYILINNIIIKILFNIKRKIP